MQTITRRNLLALCFGSAAASVAASSLTPQAAPAHEEFDWTPRITPRERSYPANMVTAEDHQGRTHFIWPEHVDHRLLSAEFKSVHIPTSVRLTTEQSNLLHTRVRVPR